MSQGPAPDEVRDTLVPTDALPAEGVRDTLVPEDAQAVEAQPPEPVLRPDPDRHARPGLALGGGIALWVVAAGIAPVLLVAWLSWPRAVVEGGPATAAAALSFETPQVDFAALRAAIPATAVAAAPSPGPAAGDATPRAEPDPSLRAFARLANRIYEAREVWRKAGQSGRELFRTATLDELGGAAFVEELQLSSRRFVWLRREARVLAPAAAQVPEGITLKDTSNDPGPRSFDGTLDGKPVRAIRTCVFGETYCVVDVVDLGQGAPVAAAAAVAAAPPQREGGDDARLAAFDAAVAREQEKLERWSPPAPAAAPGAGATATTRAAAPLGLLAGLALAAVLLGLALSRLKGVAATVVAASARLRAAAAGQPVVAVTAPAAAELALLHAAIDEAVQALGDGAARAEQASRRRARLGALASALNDASAGHAPARVPSSGDDDVALAALVASINAALERFPARPPAP